MTLGSLVTVSAASAGSLGRHCATISLLAFSTRALFAGSGRPRATPEGLPLPKERSGLLKRAVRQQEMRASEQASKYDITVSSPALVSTWPK